MDPRLPMGRWDYFWASAGVTLICFVLYLFTCTFIGFCFGLEAGLTGRIAPSAEELPSWLFNTASVICFLPNILLEYRRCKAAQIPYFMIWIAYTFSSIISFNNSAAVIQPLALTMVLIYLWIWLAPNKIEPVTKNPNK